MIYNNDPFVIEYNCRLGDPETQVVIPRLKNDLAEIFSAVAKQQLDQVILDIDKRCAVAVVSASGGYPGKYETGKLIKGLKEETIDHSLVFHAGTLQDGENVITNGGRILAVTAFGNNIKEAAELSVYMMEQLYFDDMIFRHDIGYEFM